jgi:hypothetical protein
MKMRLAIGAFILALPVTPTSAQATSDCDAIKTRLNSQYKVVRCGACNKATPKEAEFEAGKICLDFAKIPATPSGRGSEVVTNWKISGRKLKRLPDTYIGYCQGKSLANPAQASGCTP